MTPNSAPPPLAPSGSRHVLVTGGTGYLGRALLPALLASGHQVRALVRPGSDRNLPAGVEIVRGNPLEPGDLQAALAVVDTLVHLVGVPKPVRAIDLVSIQVAAAAVARADPRPHLVYLSVAQPAPVMRAYVAVRQEGEALLGSLGLDATCLRPWYVLGPGHRWPCLLLPVYALLRRIPATRAGAERLGFVTLRQMVAALVQAVEHPAQGVRVMEVPAITRAGEAGV